MYFRVKNILKSNRNHIFKHSSFFVEKYFLKVKYLKGVNIFLKKNIEKISSKV
jgi:hypothetical protein